MERIGIEVIKITNDRVNKNNEILIYYSKERSIVLILLGIIGITLFIFVLIFNTKDPDEVVMPVLCIIASIMCIFNGITSYGKLAIILGEETLVINGIVIPWSKIERFDFSARVYKVYFLRKINERSYIEDYRIPMLDVDMKKADLEELLIKFHLEKKKTILDKESLINIKIK